RNRRPVLSGRNQEAERDFRPHRRRTAAPVSPRVLSGDLRARRRHPRVGRQSKYPKRLRQVPARIRREVNAPTRFTIARRFPDNRRMAVPDNWYESFFHGVTLDLWRRAIPPEQTQREAEFLFGQLNCDPGAHVLDVPCGNGRLSFEIARRGLKVTGVDISEEFIDEAKSIQSRSIDPSADADGTDPRAPVDFILGDMRQLEGSSIYDAGYCFGNSFAFLGHD